MILRVYLTKELVNTEMKKISKSSGFLWILFISILILLIGRVAIAVEDDDEQKANSLYGPNDNILLLNADNFANEVYNEKKAFFVEFFSSWCGACIGYAPTYKKLASLVKQWKPVVEIAALDCADDRNLALCRDHNVDAYPTIKYFKYMSANKDDGVKFTGDKFNLNELPLAIAALVHNDWAQYPPAHWPIFDPNESHSTLENIWSTVPAETSLIALIVENYPPRTAWAEMIAFAYDKRVHVAQIRSNHPEAQKLGISGALTEPQLILLKKGQTEPIFLRGITLWPEMQEKINEYIAAIDEKGQQPELINKQENEEENKPKVTWSQFEVQMIDIMTALRYILMAEIPRKPVIKGDDLKALKLWVLAMKKYMPGTLPIRKLLYRLNKWISGVSDEITAEQWSQKVKTIQEQLGQPLPKSTTYMACRGSKPHLRGFSCGVWTIIHAMSVQAYKLESTNPKYNANNDLIEPFHQFIWHFFSCLECAKHFHDGILRRNMTAVVTPGDGILWFWMTHNIVNKFLVNTPSDDPAFPKQQFPPSSLCPACRKPDEKFDEKAVLDFMINYYGNPKVDGLASVPGYKVSDFQDGRLVNVEMKHLNSKVPIAAFNVDAEEEAEERHRNGLDDRQRWKNMNSGAYGRRFDGSPEKRSFYALWLSVIAAVTMVFEYAATSADIRVVNFDLY